MCSYLLFHRNHSFAWDTHTFFFLLSLSIYKLLVFRVSHTTFTFYFKWTSFFLSHAVSGSFFHKVFNYMSFLTEQRTYAVSELCISIDQRVAQSHSMVTAADTGEQDPLWVQQEQHRAAKFCSSKMYNVKREVFLPYLRKLRKGLSVHLS